MSVHSNLCCVSKGCRKRGPKSKENCKRGWKTGKRAEKPTRGDDLNTLVKRGACAGGRNCGRSEDSRQKSCDRAAKKMGMEEFYHEWSESSATKVNIQECIQIHSKLALHNIYTSLYGVQNILEIYIIRIRYTSKMWII